MSENIRKEIISWIKLVATAFIIAFLLKTYIFQIAYVKGPSMEPTLYEGQILIVSKLSYRVGEPSRGDIVVLSDNLEHKDLIKRVIGLPGDNVDIRDGYVYIDGELLKEDYIQVPTYANEFQQSQVPENKYFVLGDNRPESRDSRSDSLGFVDRENILGKAVFRLWPLNKFGTIK
ncbi:signal peptidase I [Lutispora thermophila]|uniref:Signal peptidase I n=1 Tax=Lutispora thermophila DSM 19022 TaxID=1122184 RepID=A0A1M6I982_9FIRM|nr:signal peptidase I [Lutispora thermophila]SHJ30956.1 signal peptidase I [Lutispora thermophila DSM 19022]